MLVTTPEQQRLLAKVIQKVGGFANLEKLERRRRYAKEHGLEWDINKEIKKLRQESA